MTTRQESKFLFLIIVIFIAACIETDIYLPAFPDMMRFFGATEGSIQGLLTWNFVGICLSGPFYGPIADAFGRRRPLMIALGLFLLGSIITCLAQNLDQMLWGRILQGLGSGGCFTLGTAIIFDVFEKEKGVKALNSINTVIPLIMAAAPMIGGYLNQAFGFRSNFLAIAIFVFLSFIVSLFFFEETLKSEKRSAFKVRPILRDFKQVFCCLGFWQITMVSSLLFGGYISFLSGTAVLFVIEFGVSKALFPLFQAAMLGGWVMGSLLLSRSMKKWGIPKIKRAGAAFIIFGALDLAVASLITPQNPWTLTLGPVLYAFGANWIIGLYFPESMEILPAIKGITASLATSVRLLIAALVVGFTSSLYNATIYPLAAVIIASTALIIPMLYFYEKRRLSTPAAESDVGGITH
jgi:DHA1 family bicyclomycin/chloramphenicol resistance-like MFS transporter